MGSLCIPCHPHSDILDLAAWQESSSCLYIIESIESYLLLVEAMLSCAIIIDSYQLNATVTLKRMA